MAKTNMKTIFGMSFPFLSNTDVNFDAEKLTSRKYIIIELMSIAKRLELIDKHKFMEAALNRGLKAFVVYVTALEEPISIMTMYLLRELLLVALE